MRRSPPMLAMLAILLTGCQAWEPLDRVEDVPPEAAAVRVQTRDGTRITLDDATIRGDTVYSQARWCSWTLAYGRAPGRAWCGGIALAAADIVRVEIPVGRSPWANLGIVLLGFVVGAMVIAGLEFLVEAGSAMRERMPRRPREESPSRR